MQFVSPETPREEQVTEAPYRSHLNRMTGGGGRSQHQSVAMEIDCRKTRSDIDDEQGDEF